jgi:hypothetical protein
MKRDHLGARLDAWITREPDWDGHEPAQPRCLHCQAWLPYKPERTEDKESTEHCDGKRR